MVSIVPSDYTDIQKLAQRIPEHPSDILVQRYEANSYSNQSVRWSITANSPNSLLDSEVYLYARIKLDLKDCVHNGATACAVTHSKLREQTSQKRDFDVLSNVTKADQAYWDQPITMGAGKNLGFCQRQVSGFWNAVDSLTVELNSATSVSVRPSDWIWATDEFLVTDGDDWAGFPDSGCGGRFIGRSFGVQSSPDPSNVDFPNQVDANDAGVHAAIVNPAAIQAALTKANASTVVGGVKTGTYAITNLLGNTCVAGDEKGWRPEFRVYEVDRNMADRCQKFQESIVRCAVNTTQQYSATPEFLLVTRLPARPFSYYRANFGSGRRSYLPYCQKMSIQLNFKPQGEAIRNWFQCTALPHCGSADAQVMNCGFGTIVSGTTGAVIADRAATAGNNAGNLAIVGVDRGLVDVRSQIIGSSVPAAQSSWSFAAKPYLVMKWIQPKDNFRLQSAYTISLPRYVVHKIESDLGGVDAKFRSKAQGAELRFSSLQLSVLPKMFLLVCRPNDGSGDIDTADAATLRAAKAGFFLRSGRIDCSYQNTFDCLVDPDSVDFSAQDGNESEFPGYGTTSTALQFTINNKSGLTASYSARDLYRLSKKNLGFKFSFTTWIKDKCIIALSPQDLPADKLAYSYNPTTLSIVGRWRKNQFHNLRSQKHTLSLILMYEDSLTLSSGSASSQALVMPNRSGAGSTGRGISTADDLSR